MLKSYEAIYEKGKLRWIGEEPPIKDQSKRVLVVMEVEQEAENPKESVRELLTRTRGSLGGTMTIDEIDAEVRAMREEWEREWDR